VQSRRFRACLRERRVERHRRTEARERVVDGADLALDGREHRVRVRERGGTNERGPEFMHRLGPRAVGERDRREGEPRLGRIGREGLRAPREGLRGVRPVIRSPRLEVPRPRACHGRARENQRVLRRERERLVELRDDRRERRRPCPREAQRVPGRDVALERARIRERAAPLAAHRRRERIAERAREPIVHREEPAARPLGPLAPDLKAILHVERARREPHALVAAAQRGLDDDRHVERATLRCVTRRASFTSARKRASIAGSEKSPRSILSATTSSSSRSRTLKTLPIAPAPSTPSTA